MTTVIKANKERLKQFKKIAARFTKNAPREINAAINEATKQLRTYASTLIRSRLAAKKKDIDNKLRRGTSKVQKLQGVLYISEKSLGLGKFSKSQNKKGVSVKIAKQGSRVLFPGAFGPKRERIKPHVYKRQGEVPFPLQIMPAVPFAPNVKAHGGINDIRRQSRVLLKKNIDRRIKLLQLRASGKVPHRNYE